MKNSAVSNQKEDLVRQGFKPTVLSVQKFSVVCATKYDMSGDQAHFHLPPNGLRGSATIPIGIEVKLMSFIRNDLTINQTLVVFGGKEYLLEGIRNGLSGSCLVIGIYKEDDEELPVWHLYTDTPSSNPDHHDFVMTSELIRKWALEAIERQS